MEMYELKEFYCSLAQSSIEKVDFINQPLAFHYPI